MIAYWYPDPTGTVEVLSLTNDRQPTDLQERPMVKSAEAESGTGASSSIIFGRALDIEITIEKIALAEESDRRKLRNLVLHMQAGGRAGIGLTSGKAYGTFIGLTARRADTTLRVTGPVWYNPSAALASGDAVVLETGSPYWLDEELTLSGGLASNAFLASTSSLLHTFPLPLHMRHRDFYPICRFTASERAKDNHITSRHRITSDVRLRFRYCLSEVMALSGGSGARVRQVGALANTGRGSIEQAIAEAHADLAFGNSLVLSSMQA